MNSPSLNTCKNNKFTTIAVNVATAMAAAAEKTTTITQEVMNCVSAA